MKRFLYRVPNVLATGFWGGKIDAQELTNRQNELGREGCELTSSVNLNMTQGAFTSVLIMLNRERL